MDKSEKKQVGCRGKRVTCMYRQQVNAERCGGNGYDQAKLGTEKARECVHVRSNPCREVRIVLSAAMGLP
jgi:hypothetical protein